MLTSAKVRVFNWGSVLAVTMQVEPRRVVIIQSTNQEILALLPTPRPDAVASRHISGARPRSITPSVFDVLRDRLQVVALPGSRTLHVAQRRVGLAPWIRKETNCSKSSAICGSQSSVMRACSSCGEYFIYGPEGEATIGVYHFPTRFKKFSKNFKIMVECVQGSRKVTRPDLNGPHPTGGAPHQEDRCIIGDSHRLPFIGMDIACS